MRDQLHENMEGWRKAEAYHAGLVKALEIIDGPYRDLVGLKASAHPSVDRLRDLVRLSPPAPRSRINDFDREPPETVTAKHARKIVERVEANMDSLYGADPHTIMMLTSPQLERIIIEVLSDIGEEFQARIQSLRDPK